jgi:glutathione peroxidase
MTHFTLFALLAASLLASSPGTAGVLDQTVQTIDGDTVSLERYRGEVLLIVNVASRCGNTPQYEGLESLYNTYRARGLRVLGFPANNFGGQEPGSNDEIKEFCTTTYGVTFDMFSKISVAGEDQHPLYAFLTSKGKNPEFGGAITWNFTKFLVGRDGKVLGRFGPKVQPLSEEVTSAVEAALKAK